jgi:hypothetical protein
MGAPGYGPQPGAGGAYYGGMTMLTTVEGVYQNGLVELVELTGAILEGTRVVVTSAIPNLAPPTNQSPGGTPRLARTPSRCVYAATISAQITG